jgi:Outer membrane protein beta-barrel domain
MKRVGFAVIVLTFAVVRAASAQERAAGAGRVELSAFPGGGTFFTKGSDGSETKFKNYALGASALVNFNRFIGAEAEVGGGLGVKQTLTFNDVALGDMESPNTLAYNGNIVYNPVGSDRGVIPYATGGIGGLTMFSRTELEPLGLTSNQTFLSENIGGGLRWYPSKNWGVRGDYRFIVVNSKNDAGSFFGLDETRYGHRVYGSVLFTFGE